MNNMYKIGIALAVLFTIGFIAFVNAFPSSEKADDGTPGIIAKFSTSIPQNHNPQPGAVAPTINQNLR